jgi:SPP1 gp7 family putative phage head morphogenesis protein
LAAEQHLATALTGYFTGLQDRIAAYAEKRKSSKDIPLSFWTGEDTTLLAILGPQLTRMAYSGMHIAAEKAGIAFDSSMANQAAADWAATYTDTLLQQLNTTTQDGVGPIVEDWINTDGATMGDLFQSLMDTGLMGADRASMIATTETTRAFAQGEIAQYSQMGITQMRWQTNNDELVCDICEPLNGEVRTIGDEFDDGITDPPGHVNCRCWLTPVVSEKHIKVMAEGTDAGGGFWMNPDDKSKLPSQINPDPKKADATWLKDNNPRVSEFLTGTDENKSPMIAYLVDGDAVRTNVWQDWTSGGNHERYPWIPDGEYWLDVDNVKEYKKNLAHETVEDWDMRDKGDDYSDAHSYHANVTEYKMRHGATEDDILKELGWNAM